MREATLLTITEHEHIQISSLDLYALLPSKLLYGHLSGMHPLPRLHTTRKKRKTVRYSRKSGFLSKTLTGDNIIVAVLIGRLF